MIQILLGKYSLFIEKSLGECVIFFFDSFGFSFSDTHIETCWASFHRLCPDSNLSLWCRGDRTPLARRNFHELVEQYLVVFIDSYVFFICEEFFGLFSIISIFLEHLSNLLGLSYSFLASCDLAHFTLMDHLFSK